MPNRAKTMEPSDLCRRKKAKCHFKSGQPCFNCLAQEVPCTFSQYIRKRGPPKGYSEQLESRIQQVQQLLQEITDNRDIDELLRQIDDDEDERRKKRQKKDNIQVNGSSFFVEDRRPRSSCSSRMFFTELDSLHSRQWPPGNPYDSVSYLGDTETLQVFSSKLHLDKGKKQTWKGHSIRKFGDRVVLVADDDSNEAAANGNKIPNFQWMEVAPKTKDVHRYIHWVTGVDAYTSARLLKIYFANIHPILPVINKQEFLRQYRDQAKTFPSGELLNAMFGAAARFVECESLEPERKRRLPPDARWDLPVGWSDHFFDQAQNIINGDINQPTMSRIQAIVLTHNQRGNVDSKSSACWLMGGLAVRLAQGLGLNRNCDDWDIPESEKETRKRLWWTLYITDRFQSALHGRPLSIRDEDNDVSYPDCYANWSEVYDEPEEDVANGCPGPRFPSATTKPRESEKGQRVAIYQLFIEFVKLSQILGKLLQGLYTPKAQQLSCEYGSDTLVASLDRELTDWRNSFPRALKQSNVADFNEEDGYFAPVIASTLLFYFTSLILLHRPFIESSTMGTINKSQPGYSSHRICTSAATLGIRIAAKMTIHDFLLSPYAFSLYPVIQCCLIHIYNTKNPEPRISAAAKADLERGIALMDRLHGMSSTAQKMRAILHSIMNNKNIELTTTPTEVDALYKRISTSLPNESMGPISRHGEQEDDQARLASPKDSFAVNNDSNQTTTKKLSVACESMSSLIDAFLPEQPVSDNLTSSSTLPRSSQQFLEEALSDEAFTLQQFGIDLLRDSNIPEPNHQVGGTYSAERYNKPQAMFGQSSESLEDHTHKSINNSMLFEPMSPSTSIFRNSPENPFWGVPSSIDWNEWDDWYQRTQDSSIWLGPHALLDT